MRVNKLELTSFRNHQNFILDFSPVQLLVGPNGSGKTNVLEAIHLLSTTKTPRARYDRQLISHNENLCRIRALTNISDRETELELMIASSERFQNSSSKKVKINKVSKSLNKFAGTLNSVYFSPPDIEMFLGTPSNRRKYLDSIFFQIDFKYRNALRDYTKAVKHRNKILEQISEFGRGHSLLEIWEEKLVETGGYIQQRRQDLFDYFSSKLPHYARLLNGKESNYEVDYLANYVSFERFEDYRNREIAARTTLIGPHRDDFDIKLDGHSLGYFGSRGQQRSTLLALKLCEIDFLTDATGKRPILLLDDIFSELDESHRDAVLGIVGLQQTIITSAIDVSDFFDVDGLGVFSF